MQTRLTIGFGRVTARAMLLKAGTASQTPDLQPSCLCLPPAFSVGPQSHGKLREYPLITSSHHSWRHREPCSTSVMEGAFTPGAWASPESWRSLPAAISFQHMGFLVDQRSLCGPLNTRELRGTSQVSHCKNSRQHSFYNLENQGLRMLLCPHVEMPLCHIRFCMCPKQSFLPCPGCDSQAMPLPALCLEMQGLDLEESQLPSNLPTLHHKSATLNIRLPQRLFWKVPLNIFRMKSKVAK